MLINLKNNLHWLLFTVFSVAYFVLFFKGFFQSVRSSGNIGWQGQNRKWCAHSLWLRCCCCLKGPVRLRMTAAWRSMPRSRIHTYVMGGCFGGRPQVDPAPILSYFGSTTTTALARSWRRKKSSTNMWLGQFYAALQRFIYLHSKAFLNYYI